MTDDRGRGRLRIKVKAAAGLASGEEGGAAVALVTAVVAVAQGVEGLVRPRPPLDPGEEVTAAAAGLQRGILNTVSQNTDRTRIRLLVELVSGIRFICILDVYYFNIYSVLILIG